MESRMDKIFQAYIDNEISLDEICTKFNITSWDFFNKLANFCNLHFVDLDEDNDFI
ncbi:type II/IV secretion system protein, partial [Campylobacter jejuni]|nr:type II/IV secretion system protein [Campylobacter jejuni]